MKKNTTRRESNSETCKGNECASCKACVEFEEVRPRWKDQPSQLYGKEAEHYFFYFTPDRIMQ